MSTTAGNGAERIRPVDYPESQNLTFYRVKLPVEIIPRHNPNFDWNLYNNYREDMTPEEKQKTQIDWLRLTYKGFMEPMNITVADDYQKGLNAYVTKASANAIALSMEPVIVVGGRIGMWIKGEFSGSAEYELDSNARDEHARLYPSGVVRAQYEAVEIDNYTTQIEPLTSGYHEPIFKDQTKNVDADKDHYTDEKEGQALINAQAGPSDAYDKAENYSFDIPAYNYPNGDTKYELVAIKIVEEDIDVNGNIIPNSSTTTYYANGGKYIGDDSINLSGDLAVAKEKLK